MVVKIFLVLVVIPALGQQNSTAIFQELNKLTGPDYKLLNQQEPFTPLYRIGVIIGLNLPVKPGDHAFGAATLDSISSEIYNDPTLFKMLFEELGGEFFPGEPGSNRNISNISLSPAFQWGIGLDRSLGNGFRFGIGFRHHRHELSGEFPVTVYIPDQEVPFKTTGQLTSNVTFNTVDLKGTYFLTNTRVLPYAGLGLNWQWQKQSRTSVDLANQTFELEGGPTTRSYPGGSFYGGVLANISKKLSVALNLQYMLVFQQQDNIKGSSGTVSVDLFWNMN